MKKKWICLGLVALMMMSMTGCLPVVLSGEGDGQQSQVQSVPMTEEIGWGNKDDQAADVTEEATDTTEEEIVGSTDPEMYDPSLDSIEVDFAHEYTATGEVATVTATLEGEVLWTYHTGEYPAAQIDQLQMIESPKEFVYIVESSTIIAFNKMTGNEVWRNEDLMGTCTDVEIDENGTIYACGEMGPDLFIMNADGETLYAQPYFHDDYWWASDVELGDGYVRVFFNSNEQWIRVNLDDYSFELE